jgi:hypothetical protein
LLYFISCFLSFSCGKGGDGDATDILIPDLSAEWKNISIQPEDSYFFLVDNEGAASSTFNANNNFSGEQHTFSGSYQNSKIEFTFNDGPKQGTKYSGKINGNVANATMTLTTPFGTITLQRIP